MNFLLHVSYHNGVQWTGFFESAFARALVMITLAAQPVDLRTEDRT